jgi:hypothetical protein
MASVPSNPFGSHRVVEEGLTERIHWPEEYQVHSLADSLRANGIPDELILLPC